MNQPLSRLVVDGVKVPGVEGVRRLPQYCRLGDWTHWEWFKDNSDTPPTVLKFASFPRRQKFPGDADPSAIAKVKVFTFYCCLYQTNGSTYFIYRRMKS